MLLWKLVRTRLLQLLFVLLLLSLVTFALMKLAPGDPVLSILNSDELSVTKADEARLREELGFDRPLYEQYGRWMLNLLRLDLGHSYIKGKPVLDEIVQRLPTTVQLTAGGLAVMVLIAAPLGLLAARYPGRWPDQAGRILALIGASVPSFWMGLLLIYAFAFKLQWLPSMGKGGLRIRFCLRSRSAFPWPRCMPGCSGQGCSKACRRSTSGQRGREGSRSGKLWSIMRCARRSCRSSPYSG